jgi:hypothetical protein
VVSGPAKATGRLTNAFQVFTRKTFIAGSTEEAPYLKPVLNTLVGETSALLAA